MLELRCNLHVELLVVDDGPPVDEATCAAFNLSSPTASENRPEVSRSTPEAAATDV